LEPRDQGAWVMMSRIPPEDRQDAASRRTYSHLAKGRHIPTEYELVTTRLHHHTQSGFEVRVPIAEWYARYCTGSPLVCTDWERFRDPRETTYAKYTALQKQNEVFVDGILRSIDELGYDALLGEVWRGTLARVLAPSRYLFHGLQMVAAYVGQMAPSGRITIVCAFQAADEVRRIQRVAYRIRQMQDTYPSFGDDSRAIWQSDFAWQPLRAAVEQLLVTYDWGEALVALNLVVKPLIDELLISRFASLAWNAGDPLIAEILFSLNQDCQWHREWGDALFRLVAEDRPENRQAMQTFLDRWHPLALRAVEALAPALSMDPEHALAGLGDACAARVVGLGLRLPRGQVAS
jgi:toluene monooxygenase system protein E